MFLKSNDKTIRLFDTKDIDMDKFKCDQSYLNSKKDLINYRVLSPELFPVGCFYYDNYKLFIHGLSILIGLLETKK